MEHIRPLIIKFIYIAAITMIFLGYLLVPAVPMGSTLLIALVVTLVLYFAGDRYLLPRFGALPAAIANFIIAAVILVLAEPFVRQDIGAGGIWPRQPSSGWRNGFSSAISAAKWGWSPKRKIWLRHRNFSEAWRSRGKAAAAAKNAAKSTKKNRNNKK